MGNMFFVFFIIIAASFQAMNASQGALVKHMSPEQVTALAQQAISLLKMAERAGYKGIEQDQTLGGIVVSTAGEIRDALRQIACRTQNSDFTDLADRVDGAVRSAQRATEEYQRLQQKITEVRATKGSLGQQLIRGPEEPFGGAPEAHELFALTHSAAKTENVAQKERVRGTRRSRGPGLERDLRRSVLGAQHAQDRLSDLIDDAANRQLTAEEEVVLSKLQERVAALQSNLSLVDD